MPVITTCAETLLDIHVDCTTCNTAISLQYIGDHTVPELNDLLPTQTERPLYRPDRADALFNSILSKLGCLAEAAGATMHSQECIGGELFNRPSHEPTTSVHWETAERNHSTNTRKMTVMQDTDPCVLGDRSIERTSEPLPNGVSTIEYYSVYDDRITVGRHAAPGHEKASGYYGGVITIGSTFNADKKTADITTLREIDDTLPSTDS